MLDVIVSGAPNLTYLEIDHPWESPRDFPFPSPDGRTIRSDTHGDFRIVSVFSGRSISQVIVSRISTYSE